MSNNESTSLRMSDILLSKVRKGDLAVEVTGYGSLQSKVQQLITTQTPATIEKIILKPGAVVTPDKVIMILNNPELNQEVEKTRLELAQVKANLRKLRSNQKRELLNEKENFQEIRSQYEGAKLTLNAELQMSKFGITSAIKVKKAQLLEKQLSQRINILKEKSVQLDIIHQEDANIELEAIKLKQIELDNISARLDRLIVKAGIEGVLQSLSVELGQSVIRGQTLAMVGSTKELIAMIKVSQGQAQKIQPGQKAIIDTRTSKIEGIVARVDPTVVNNTVNVEINLPKNLSADARPQLNVDGTIVIQSLKNIYYIEKPTNAAEGRNSSLFKLNDSLDGAEAVAVKFGVISGRYIQLVSPSSENDTYIISDTSAILTNSVDISQ